MRTTICLILLAAGVAGAEEPITNMSVLDLFTDSAASSAAHFQCGVTFTHTGIVLTAAAKTNLDATARAFLKACDKWINFGLRGLTNVTTRVETNTVTNVVHDIVRSDPTICPDHIPGCLAMHYKFVYGAGKERTNTTTVTEIKTLRFSWEGREHTVEHRKELSKTVKKWVKREEWQEEK